MEKRDRCRLQFYDEGLKILTKKADELNDRGSYPVGYDGMEKEKLYGETEIFIRLNRQNRKGRPAL